MPPSGIKARIEDAAARAVSRETIERLEAYVSLLTRESERQNLISRGTIETIWDRHVLDSAQLARFEPFNDASWVDVGSGAGLPGVVLACLVTGPITLIEPRKLRAEFLRRAVEELELKAAVVSEKVEQATGTFDVITGRAVTSLKKFIGISRHLSTRKTVWALPKGRSAQTELAEAKRSWQGTFHVEQSVTHEDSFIVVGTGVEAR